MRRWAKRKDNVGFARIVLTGANRRVGLAGRSQQNHELGAAGGGIPMTKVRPVAISAMLVIALLPTAQAQDDDPHPFLRFASRTDHVERSEERRGGKGGR